MPETIPQAKSFPWIAALLPVLLVLGVYGPCLHYGFLAWDDLPFIYDNPHLRSFDLPWIWTTFQTGNWIPLTWLSLCLDFQIAGSSPGICHLTNLLLHLANSFLVFALSRRILLLASGQAGESEPGKGVPVDSAAFLASLLFGLHPVHVESVAWISERKDVLSGFFFLAGLMVYLPNPSRPWTEGRRMGASLGFFLLALLSKPMAVTFPLVLILLDYWPLGKLFPLSKKTFWGKAPFLVLSLAAGSVAVLAQSTQGGMIPMAQTTFSFRALNAFHSIAFYLWKMAAPTDLSPLYPFDPAGQRGLYAGALVGILILVGTGWVCYGLRKKKPFLDVVWLYTVITLFPVLGFLQVGYQAAADRYLYLPSAGLFLLAGTGAAYYLSAKPFLTPLFSTLLAGGLIYGTLNQLPVWKDSISLWEQVVRLYPDSSQLPHANLARSYAIAGRWQEALGEYDRALGFPPDSSQIRLEKGTVLMNLGRVDEAISEFKAAIGLDPGAATLDCRRDLWRAYEKKGMHGDALSEIQEVVKLDPSAEDYFDAGITYWEMKDFKKSEEALTQAYNMDSGNAEYVDTLAALYQKSGRLKEAADLYRKALEIRPAEAEFLTKLADLDILQKLYPEAVEALRRAEALQPQNPEIREKLERAIKKEILVR